MKRLIVWIVFSVSALLIGIIIVRSLKYPEIPLLYEYSLRYSISPLEAERRLGPPTETQTNNDISNRTWYLFEVSLLGHPAKVECFFVSNNSLSEIDIQWVFVSEEQAQEMTATVKNILQTAYQDHKHYFIKDGNADGYARYISMGTNNGATGLIYDIKQIGNTVIVICIYNY